MNPNGLTAGAESPTVLDSNTVTMLKELGGADDPGLFSELVDTFVADSSGRIDAIESAARDGALDRIASEAHSLKSSSGNMGANRLMALCKSLEVAGRERRLADARGFAERLRSEYEHARDALFDARRT